MEYLLSLPLWLVIPLILAVMFTANEIGFYLGRRQQLKDTEMSRSTGAALKASVLGMVALLLGFSFSITANRYDQRRRLILTEANAIGTCYLRAGFLKDAERDAIRGLLREYVDVRLNHAEAGLDEDKHESTVKHMDHLQHELWLSVEALYRDDPQPAKYNLMVQATNDVLDLSGERAWAMRHHLPASVLLLLSACILISNLLIGHSSGQASRRHLSLWTACNLLLALLILVIIDLDQPRHGLVQQGHEPLQELKRSLDAPIGSLK